MKTLLSIATVFVSFGSLHAAPVIDEPFADSDSPLSGNTPGTGLTGTWNGGSSYTVETDSYSYGSLQTSGNRTENASGRTGMSVGVGSSLSDAKLLDGGATLWFSVLHLTHPNASGNMDFGFALGTNGLSGSNNVPMNDGGDGGQGLGFSVKNGLIQATFWDATDGGTAAERAGGVGFTNGAVTLIVGEVIWGTGGGLDTVNLYTPDTSLTLGAIVSTIQEDLDQANFDLVTFANKADDLPIGIDEIRFGATYDDVVPTAATDPEITSFTALGPDLWELTLTGEAGTGYEFYSSTTLDFTPGTLVKDLTQGDPGDDGTIGGVNASVLTTDDNGDGTGNGKVRVTLTGTPQDFIRAQR